MKRAAGFTLIELVFIIVVLALLGIVLVNGQKSNGGGQDSARKVAINAMYYNLEEVYYKQHGYYPVEISSGSLPAMDPSLFTDPDGHQFGTPLSEYRYEPAACIDEKCQSYVLRADLKLEADYVKKSRH